MNITLVMMTQKILVKGVGSSLAVGKNFKQKPPLTELKYIPVYCS